MDEIKTTPFANNKERLPDPMRYEHTRLHYRRAGNSGLKLPEISLGLWQNFGSLNNFENMRDMILPRSTRASPCSTLQTTTVRVTAVRKKTSEKFCAIIYLPTATKC